MWTRQGRHSKRSSEGVFDVPYIRQEGSGATRYANDCGCACVAMWLAFAGLPTPSVDSLCSETPLASKDDGLTPLQLVTLAKAHGLSLAQASGLNLSAIQAEIDSGQPVLMLIDYGSILGRQNQADRSGHFVIVLGYTAQSVIVNDPDWWGADAEKGHRFEIPLTQFINAIDRAPIPRTGLIAR